MAAAAADDDAAVAAAAAETKPTDDARDGGSSGGGANTREPIVQYILVRTDLNWSTGAVIAQACHASMASVANTISDRATKDYLADLENMHKVILKAEKLDDITKAEAQLKEAKIAHHVWIEKPENVISCLAVSPQPKALVQAIFKHLKLLR